MTPRAPANTLIHLMFFGFLTLALGACTASSPLNVASSSAMPLAAPKALSIEGEEHCPALYEAINIKLNQRDITVSPRAPMVLILACGTRPRGVMILQDGMDRSTAKYSGSLPLVSEASILAYNRDGEFLKAAGAAVAHKQGQAMNKEIADAVITEMFGPTGR